MDKSTKAWYVSCSPRSPEKIAPELKLMVHARGKVWNGVYTKELHKNKGLSPSTFEQEKKKFEEEKRKNQEFIAKKLADLPDFKGDTFDEEISFSIRDRVAPMKTYGFLYVDKENKLRITDAGMMIINDHRPKEVFMKQMLKWQYPSYQHGVARPHPLKYPESKFNIFPYVATLHLIYLLDGLTKQEIAIFCLTTRKFNETESVKKEIENFRLQLSKIHGKNPRKEFIQKYHYDRFHKIYHEEAISGKKIREGKTQAGAEEYIKTKIRNSGDIADAATRYFRYTGLLSSKGNRVIILSEREKDVREILSGTFKLYPYKDVNKFYKYFGNPTIPKLSYEENSKLIVRINKVDEKSRDLFSEIKKLNLKTQQKLISIPQLDKLDAEKLKDIYYELLENKILLKRDRLVGELQNSSVIENTIIPDLEIYTKSSNEINDIISEKFISDKNSVFEFVVWRALIAFGDALEYKNNFLIDEELNILNHAPGYQGDMEIYYDDFVLLTEVTTSSGLTQFKMEGEPVTRHCEVLDRDTKLPTYCLFIANTVNDNTYKEFLRYNKLKKTRIVPLSLIEFINIINKQKDMLKEGEVLNSKDLQLLLDSILSKLNSITNINQWKNLISTEVKKFAS